MAAVPPAACPHGASVGKVKGFTLIELLAVIAVVGAPARLMPAFVRARDDARMAIRASNLHLVTLALWVDANARDGEYPPENTYDIRKESGWRGIGSGTVVADCTQQSARSGEDGSVARQGGCRWTSGRTGQGSGLCGASVSAALPRRGA